MGESKTLTYEMLYGILRTEKSTSRLQTLQDSFYRDCREYFKEKKQLLEKKDNKFARKNLLLTQKQIENTEKLLEDLFSIRTKKLILLAQDKLKIDSFIIDYTPMLSYEKEFFENILNLMKDNKEKILQQIFDENIKLDEDSTTDDSNNKEEISVKENNQSDKVKVEFTQEVAKFLDAKMNEYGPYNKGDVAELPATIVKILESKEAIKKI